jgi:4-amino-4-deoxy-L-arabinose transferase-like glycosyltransferase
VAIHVSQSPPQRRAVAWRPDLSGLAKASPSTWTLAVLYALAVGGACAFILAFVVAALFRLGYPFPLEITEGASLEAVRRILNGQPLYTTPSLDYVPLIYGPLFFYVSAAVAFILGPTFAALRLVSLVASLGSIVLVCLFVRRETGNLAAGLAGAGILAASYPIGDTTLDVGRVDALSLCLVLAAFYAGRSAGLKASITSGILIGLALLTKQAAAPAALALLAYCAFKPPRVALGFVVALGLTVGLPLLLLSIQSGPWPGVFLWDLPRRHEVDVDRLGPFWPTIILPRFTLAVALGPLFLLRRALARDWRTIIFYGLAAGSMLGSAWITHANRGAAENVLLPAFGILAVFFGLGLHSALKYVSGATRKPRPLRGYVLGLGIFQCLVMLYNPRLTVPYRSELWADQRLAASIGALQGAVFAPDFLGYLGDTPNPDQAFLGAAGELVGIYGGKATPAGDAWTTELRQALVQRKYDYVVLDPDSFMYFVKGIIENAGYVDAGPMFGPNDEFWLWRTGRIPKAEVYVPRERLGSGIHFPG